MRISTTLGFTSQQAGFAELVLIESFDFTTTPILPSWITYTGSGANGIYIDGNNKMQQSAANAVRRAQNGRGFFKEGGRTNKCTAYNINPTATTGLTKGGDAASVLSIVTAAAGLLSAAKWDDDTTIDLSAICSNGKIIKLDNTGGTTPAYIEIDGTTANINPHSLQAFVQSTNGAQLKLGTAAAVTNITAGPFLKRYMLDNVTPATTNEKLRIYASPGSIVYTILFGLEEARKVSSPIVVQGATGARPADKFAITGTNFPSHFNTSEGVVLADFSIDDIVNHPAQHFVIMSEGTNLTNCISSYMINGRARARSRIYANSVSLSSADIGSIDKGAARTTIGFSYRNGQDITMYSGAYHKTFAMTDTAMNMNRVDIGGRPFVEDMCGHLRSFTVCKKYRTPAQLADYLVKPGENVVLMSGQSNAGNAFGDQATNYNGGEKSGVSVLDTVWTSKRNWLAHGATAGSTVLLYGDLSSGWINPATGQIGAPFERWIAVAQSCRKGNIRAIIDVAGETDAGNCTKQEYKDGQLAKFSKMREYAGNIPVLLAPLGRRTDNAALGFQTIRDASHELVAENPWIHMAPERYDLSQSDYVHLTDAGHQIQMRRYTRKLLSVLGESVVGPVDGPGWTATRSGAVITVTLTHNTFANDFTGNGAGCTFYNDAATMTMTFAKISGTQFTLTLPSAPAGTAKALYYGYAALYGVNEGNIIRDNSSEALPLRSGKVVF